MPAGEAPARSLDSGATTAAPDTTAEGAPTDTSGSTVTTAPTGITALPDTTAPGPVIDTGEWTDVTGNLAGVESDCGNMSFVTAHPTLDQVIAGVALRGLWTLDAGSTAWFPLGTGSGSATITNRMSGVAYDPADPMRFWESGIYAEGVFETRDGGETFDQLGTVAHVDLVSVDFTDPERSTLLAGGHEGTALYHSTDGGATWTDLAENLPSGVGFTSYPVVLDARTFLLGTNNGDGAGIFRSEDAGATWSRVFDAPVTGAPVVAGELIAWLSFPGGGLVVSDDGGVTFTPADGATGGRQSSLISLPDGRLAALGQRTIVISADLGASWTEFGPELPYEPSGLAYSAARSSFYIKFSTCDFSGAGNPVPERAVMQLDLDSSSG
jgi:photosystem II stability/assembly factor-like uncharacterized protein